MKRNFYALGLMLAAAFTLTNCTKEFENPSAEPEGVPFEIVASTVDTKTANDGMSTKWVANDAINIFHAVAGTTTYGTNDKFTITSENLAANKFTGELKEGLADDKSYDWYALYPYSSDIKTPGVKDAGFTYIGNKAGLKQKGYDNMEHISGTNCPLYGVSKNVPSTDFPAIDMYHLSSVLKVNVKNGTDAPLVVDEVSFTAGDEELVGSFYINITGADVDYKASSVNYVNTTSKVTVENGTELEKGQTAIVYLVVKPFTASTGEKLSLIVNGAVKEITLPKAVTFEAGHIKTLNYEFTQAASAEKVNVTEFIEAEKSDTKLYEVTGTIVSIDEISAYYKNATVNIADDNGNEVKIYRMKPADGGLAIDKIGLSLGDKLTVQGYRSDYNGTPQMKEGGVYVSHEDACEPPVILCDNNIVSISCPTGGAKLFYTTGTEYVEYTEPIDIKKDETVKAYATADGMLKSLVVSVDCKYNAPNAGTKYYVKVTSTPADWSGTYLIVYETDKLAFDGSLTTLDAVGNTKSVTISNNKIEATSDINKISFEINSSGYIKSASGYYIGQNSDANGLKSSKTTPYTNSFSINADKSVNVISGKAYLRYNAANNQTRFRYYKSGTYTGQKAISLYKLED